MRASFRLTLGMLGLVATPSVSFAAIHFADTPFDATTLSPIPALGSSLDSSPSIAAGTTDTWLAFARTPADGNGSQSAVVVMSVDPVTGPHPGPPSLLLPASDLADVSIAHDGARFLAAYSRTTDTTPTGADVYLWPIAPSTDPSTNLLMMHAPGRSLDLTISPLVRNDGIPFVLSYFDSTHGMVVAAGVFASNATYTAGVTVPAIADTGHYDGRPGRVGLESLFALSSDTNGVLLRDSAATWGSVPSALHATADVVVRTADVVVAAASSSSSVRLSAIDRAAPHAVTAAWPADVAVTGMLTEIALTTNLRGGEWLVTLSSDVTGLVLGVSTHNGTEHATFANPGFAVCQRLHAAPFASDHDTLAITAQCAAHSTDPAHIIVWLVHRDPPVVADAGTDAAVDAAVDATDVAEDAPVDASAGDASMPGLDAFVQGTGPSFRGSGCSCATVTVPVHRATPGLAAAALALIAACVRRNRRTPSRNT